MTAASPAPEPVAMDRHLFTAAVRFHEMGALPRAATLYRQLLQQDPNHLELWCRLGDLCVALHNRDEAAESYEQALRLKPDHPGVHNNLGLIRTEQRRLDEAAACFHTALRLRPEYAEAHNHLGIVLSEQGKLDEAVACYRQAINLKPNYAPAYQNLGITLARQGKPADALAHLQQALRLQPDSPSAYLHQGNLLRSMGRRAEALTSYQEGLRRAPNNPDLHNEWAMTVMQDGRFEEAEGGFRQALRLRPEFVPVYNTLAICLLEQRRWDEAMVLYRQALHLDPNFVDAHTNMGRAYAVRGMLDEAFACWVRAVELGPNHPGALNNLGNVCRDQGRLAEAVEYYRRAVRARPEDAAVHSNLLFALNYLPGADPADVFRDHLEFGCRHAAPVLSHRPCHLHPCHSRLRVGYLSPDFRDHVVAFFLEPILAEHDHQTFEIFCYADVSRPDAVTRRLQNYADHWRPVTRMPHEQVVDFIRDDEIDLLVDLAGHTGGNRLPVFAQKPAPVQITYLGYMGTTGLPTIDYRITDAHADPPGLTEAIHTEQLVRLPQTGLCYRPPESPEVNPLPAAASGRFTFGSFNNIAKVSVVVVAIWSRALACVPGSRLMLKTGAGSQVDERLRQTFVTNGVAAERVQLIGKTPSRAEYFRLYNQVDLCLDPFPYNGITTTCDALWMGVPVLTLAGRTSVSRQGVSLLRNVGLAELIAETPEDYVELARQVATELDRLAEWRSQLRQRMSLSPLTDAVGFTRHLEAAYQAVWQEWLARANPGDRREEA